MNNQIFSIILAFIASSMINLAQGTQKIGMDTPKEKFLKKWGIWLVGTVFMMSAPFVIQYATSLGGASLVGAMSGTGLATLALFSHFVMREKIKRNEIGGVAVILGASVLIGVFSTGKAGASIINVKTLIIYVSIISVFYVILTVISLRLNKLAGIVIGGFSGAVGGYVTLFQKVTMSNPAGAKSILTNPYFYTWIVISLFSFLILQFSYKYDKAIRIIPAISSNFILVPVIGGVVCFQESLNPFQWAGVVLILCGVLLITIKPGQSKETA